MRLTSTGKTLFDLLDELVSDTDQTTLTMAGKPSFPTRPRKLALSIMLRELEISLQGAELDHC
jgi:hypothetical protein